MDKFTIIPRIPLPAVFFGTFLLVILSIFLGYKIGVYQKKRYGGKEKTPMGTVVGATLGLLAFMLAFTFGITAARFDARKQLVLDDVNAIGTLFLRTDFLVEPYRTEIRKLLRDYVHLRTEWIDHPEKLEEDLTLSEEIQNKVWSRAVEAVAKTTNREITPNFYKIAQ
jgi:hypothetical protein